MSSSNPIPTGQGQEQKKEGYGEWAKRNYNQQYDRWVPWIQDQYLRLFTKDNKASYATKDTLGKTKVTGIEPVNKLQDGVNNLVGDQVGQGGLAQPAGDLVSKEGVNRAQRGGKDDQGHTAPGPMGQVTDPVADSAKKGGSSVVEGGKSVGNSVSSGAKSAGGYIGGLMGGKKEQK